MELRHLRYFVAVAEEGSLTNAAERRLHTAQPSLSRQIRDLELEIGVKLLERKVRGVALTAAGRVFLDHARLALMQIEVACEAARGTEKPEKLGFVIGFLLGQEAIWLSESLRVLREEAPDVEITLMTKSSPELAVGLMQGKIDVALLRHESQTAGLAFKFLTKEPLIAILPARHRLARHRAVRPQDLARESFISTARVAPVLRTVIDDYAVKKGITLKQNYDAETLSGGMSLVASTGGFTLLPLYVRSALIPSVVARPLRGEVPTIGLMMGYNKSSTSPLLKRFLLRADELVNRVFRGEAYSRTLKRGDRKPSV
jgi:LysR family hca operon transcriptional activator